MMKEAIHPFGLEIKIKSMSDLLEIAAQAEDIVYKNKLVLMRGLEPLTEEGFSAFTTAITKAQVKKLNCVDQLFYSDEKMHFHWDGGFKPTFGMVAYNCVVPSETGGEVYFTDTGNIYNSLAESEKALLEDMVVKYELTRMNNYEGTIFYKPVGLHPKTGSKILRFAEGFDTGVCPTKRTIKGEKENALGKKIDALMYDDNFCYKHTWMPGDVLLLDNHSLIHARMGFKCDKRKIRANWIK